MPDLYQRHRPKTFADVVGQEEAVKTLRGFITKKKVPHALLFFGPSGTGKTTCARILGSELGCKKSGVDYIEKDVADDRGIDTTREIKKMQNRTVLTGGNNRMWVYDEAHRFTKDSQEALLKMLEEADKRIYQILCTTDPDKLIATVRNRCIPIRFSAVGPKDLTDVVSRVARDEKFNLSSEVAAKIVEVAEGSPRRAVSLLEKAMAFSSYKEMIDAIEKSDPKRQAIELVRLMMDRKSTFADAVPIIKAVEGEEPESFRRMVLSYCRSSILGRAKDKAFVTFAVGVIERFKYHWYDGGHAELIASVYAVMKSRG